MDEILYIIKIWASFQLIIIILLVLFFYITRSLLSLSMQNHKKKIPKIKNLLNKINEDPNALTSDVIHFFNRSILELILCMTEIDKSNYGDPNWNRTKALITEHVLKNQVKKVSSAKSWYKKYLTILCYEIGCHIEDEQTLLKFVDDDNLIVSINASLLIFKNPNSTSVNKVISTLSEGRHILQNTFASMLSHISLPNVDLIRSIFITRLYNEENIYIRIFCYRVLNQLTPADKIDSFVDSDLLSENVNLRILALKYVVHVSKTKSLPILMRHLNDAKNEVRFTVVKLFGEIGDKSVIPYLKDMLNDKEWWVRINSANSLVNLGQDGIAVLNEQSPQNGFAYETAQACLKIYEYS